MKWQLYSSTRSPFVRKVMVAAFELGLSGKIERHDVVTNPMNPAPQVLPHNPLGMIPTLVVGDDVFFDSFVILEFMNNKASGTLLPDGTNRLECLTRHAVANGAMDKATRIIDEQFREQNRDTEEHRNGYIDAIRRTIRWMEPRLTDKRFDAGDIAFAVLLSYMDARFPDIEWPDNKVAADWYSVIEQRPSMTSTAFSIPKPT